MKQKIRVEEYYAKLLLEGTIFDEVGYLENSDRPDLRNVSKNIGIEVTDSTAEKRQELESLQLKEYEDIESKNKKDKQKKISQLEKKLIQNDLACRIGYNQSICYKRTIASIPIQINNKLVKLNKNEVEDKSKKKYEIFSHNSIFLFTRFRIKRNEFSILFKEIQKVQDKYKNKYSKIYINCNIKLYILDMTNLKHKTITISQNKIRNYWVEADKLFDKQ